MDEQLIKKIITATGCELLEAGLVARTWGNVSARLDDKRFFITPSGLDYNKTKPEDIVLYNRETKEWEGLHKPSSEKGVHAAAYETFPDVGFVIHTHQFCASAVGLAGFDTLDVTQAERQRLGGIAKAEYGLPGTKKLKNAVSAAMKSGARTVLMVNHGALVCGKDKDDAMEMIKLLEEVCERNLKLGELTTHRADAAAEEEILEAVRQLYPYADTAGTAALISRANSTKPLTAQLDDMAQMLGSYVNCVACNKEAVLRELEKRDAVLVRGMGAVIKSASADDTQALKLLLDKAAICAIHTDNMGVNVKLGFFDTALMRLVYKYKYSKQKG